MSAEREAIFEDQLRHNPEAALTDALFEMVNRQSQVIRILRQENLKLTSEPANAWERGFNYARDQFLEQQSNPNHPIQRVNPYKGEQQ